MKVSISATFVVMFAGLAAARAVELRDGMPTIKRDDSCGDYTLCHKIFCCDDRGHIGNRRLLMFTDSGGIKMLKRHTRS